VCWFYGIIARSDFENEFDWIISNFFSMNMNREPASVQYHARPLNMDDASYLNSLEILSSDFRRLCEFVEPVDANLNTYSHRLYELLLRACTEFESVCKDKLISDGYKKPGNMNIYDYRKLEPTLGLENIEVGVLLWRPNIAYVRPFIGWSSASPPLSWYDAYNRVKHNRNQQFAYASLENVRLSLGGLFALLSQLGIVKSEFGSQTHLHGVKMEIRHQRHIFSLRYRP
jgi:hypothetical protein